MNLNVIGYIIFFAIMFYVIGIVGWKFYKNGRVFLLSHMAAELHLVDPVNKLLLIAYYLFNLGYVAISIQSWEQLLDIQDLVNMLSLKSGTIILILGVTHYVNLLWLSHLHQIIEFINRNKRVNINQKK